MDDPVAPVAPCLFETKYVRPTKGRTLIVGSRIYKTREDRRLLFRNVLGVDAIEGTGVDRVLNMEDPLPKDLRSSFYHVECISVLEHSKRPWLLAENIELAMIPGGTLYVSVPFIWRVHAYPSDYWRFTIEGLAILFPKINFSVLLYGDRALSNRVKGESVNEDGTPLLPRTQVFGFGKRK
jgi:hypothetical protein